MSILTTDEWTEAKRKYPGGWLPKIKTKEEKCPECGEVGHTSRSHIMWFAGDRVLILPLLIMGVLFEEAVGTVRGHYLYDLVLTDGRVLDCESVVLCQRGEDYAEWKREKEERAA